MLILLLAVWKMEGATQYTLFVYFCWLVASSKGVRHYSMEGSGWMVTNSVCGVGGASSAKSDDNVFLLNFIL